MLPRQVCVEEVGKRLKRWARKGGVGAVVEKDSALKGAWSGGALMRCVVGWCRAERVGVDWKMLDDPVNV